eukprot:scaffold41588_cov51-Attheya_sp.AAC.2
MLCDGGQAVFKKVQAFDETYMEERFEFGGCGDGCNPIVLRMSRRHGSDHFVFGPVLVSSANEWVYPLERRIFVNRKVKCNGIG